MKNWVEMSGSEVIQGNVPDRCDIVQMLYFICLHGGAILLDLLIRSFDFSFIALSLNLPFNPLTRRKNVFIQGNVPDSGGIYKSLLGKYVVYSLPFTPPTVPFFVVSSSPLKMTMRGLPHTTQIPPRCKPVPRSEL